MPIACFAVLAGLALAAEEPKTKLWAGLGVTSPTVGADNVENAQFFSVRFALVNDDAKALNPEIVSSRLLVNGKELNDWAFIIGNGPRSQDFVSLPSGQALRFEYAMGRYFKEPGIYKIQWKGKSFESAVVEFRVLPTRAK